MALTAEQRLVWVVEEHALAGWAEPWAWAHGVLAEGREARLSDGRGAVDALLALAEDGEDGPVIPHDRGGRLIDAHPDMILKTLLEVGVPWERLARLAECSAAAFVARGFDPPATAAGVDPVPCRNTAWSLEVLAALAERDAEWAGALERGRARALETLRENTAYFAAYRRPDAPEYQKPTTVEGGARVPAEIHRYFCGGLHLFQGIQRACGVEQHGVLGGEYETLELRTRLEDDYWRRTRAQVLERFSGGEQRQHRLVIGAQRLKLLGHALETAYRAAAMGTRPVEGEWAQEVFGRLEEVVEELEEVRVWERLELIREGAPQLYRDVVGDAAHALHAYRLRASLR